MRGACKSLSGKRKPRPGALRSPGAGAAPGARRGRLGAGDAADRLALLLYCGHGTERDLALAEHWCYQAVLAGSWLATLELAGLLYQHRINERREGILENGAQSGFLPACFRLAWFRYKRRLGRGTARAIRPLREQAAAAGHPGARLLLAR